MQEPAMAHQTHDPGAMHIHHGEHRTIIHLRILSSRFGFLLLFVHPVNFKIWIRSDSAGHNLIHVDTNMIDDTYANVEDTCGCLDDRFGLSRYNPEIMLGIERRCFIKARFVALYNYY